MSELTGQKVDAMDMRAWRFWVSYLGLGYLQEMFMIPNADVFLQDVIELAGLEKGKNIHLVNLSIGYRRIVGSLWMKI